MFSFEVRCAQDQADRVSAELWDWEPLAVGERQDNEWVVLTAGFADDSRRDALLVAFAAEAPEWRRDETDWTAATEAAWPIKKMGQRIEIAAPWNREKVSGGSFAVVLRPGMASGTGEHPCTQLAAEALERCVTSDSRVADIGAGSGILALIAARLGARTVLAMEPDAAAVDVAQENISLNDAKPLLAAGFADAIADGWSTVTVANISGSVLLAIFDDLLRMTAPEGTLILSGFEESEAGRLQQMLPSAALTTRGGWACLETRLAEVSS